MRPIKKRRTPPLPLDLRRDALGQEPLYDPMREKERAIERREKIHRRRVRRPPRELAEARRRLKRRQAA